MAVTPEIAPEYQGLRYIDNVEPLSDADQKCFIELKEVLKRHGALERFGVSLLHNHFPVYAGEVMLESCDVENRVLTIRPTKIADAKVVKFKETNWRLDTKASVQGCIQVCTEDNESGEHLRTTHLEG